jgi:CheY-like chemotaxis protein
VERFSALVLSHDAEALRVINRTLDANGVEMNVFSKARDAEEAITRRRYDLAVYDYDVPGAEWLSCLDPATTFRAMVFVLTSQSKLSEIHGKRIHLLLPKPLTAGLFSKGLKAAYSTMAQDRRTSYRHSVDLQPISAELISHGATYALANVKIVDLSRTGMRMRLDARTKLPEGGTVNVDFRLPEIGEAVHASGKVIWVNESGHAGIKFNHLRASEEKYLHQWLNSMLPREPASAGFNYVNNESVLA